MKVNLPVNVLPVSFAGHGHAQTFNAPDDLPKTVMRTLNQGSSPKSMDFHPIQQTLLLGIFKFILYYLLFLNYQLNNVIVDGILLYFGIPISNDKYEENFLFSWHNCGRNRVVGSWI